MNRNRINFLADISDFQNSAKDSDITIFFFAGYGVQIEGMNYLMPIDIVGSSERSVQEGAVSVKEIVEKFPGNTRLFFIDADSDNPFKRR